MRGCLTFVVGFALGAALVLAWWPRTPATVTAPAASDVHLILSDRYLARLVEGRASTLGPATLTDLTIASAPPSVLVARAQVSIGGLAVPLTVEAQPVAENGKIQIQVLTTRIGTVPIPGEVTSALTSNINSSLQHLVSQGTVVKVVRVTPTGLEIYADSV